MAYATSNPPALVAQRVGSGMAIWSYQSTDNLAAVLAAGYFTNGEELGMKVGDHIHMTDTDGVTGSLLVVSAVGFGAATAVVAIFA